MKTIETANQKEPKRPRRIGNMKINQESYPAAGG
jgi:hypothetical protein